jgi:hypothetical protein
MLQRRLSKRMFIMRFFSVFTNFYHGICRLSCPTAQTIRRSANPLALIAFDHRRTSSETSWRK